MSLTNVVCALGLATPRLIEPRTSLFLQQILTCICICCTKGSRVEDLMRRQQHVYAVRSHCARTHLVGTMKNSVLQLYSCEILNLTSHTFSHPLVRNLWAFWSPQLKQMRRERISLAYREFTRTVLLSLLVGGRAAAAAAHQT